MNELTVFDYASKISHKPILSFYDAIDVLLPSSDCIICLESAADLLGYTNGGYIKKIHVYTTEYIDKPYLECHIVDNLEDIPNVSYNGYKVSPINQAIIDMLNYNNTDIQVLYEIFAQYYCINNNSYNNLIIPKSLEAKATHFMEEGRLFYGS